MQEIEIIIYIGLFLALYFGIFMFLTFFENKKRIYKKITTSFPLVSILVPCYNEEDNIENSIRSLKNLDYPNLEIIVIDDGSTDRTLEKVNAIEGIKVLRKENGGKYTALNLGIEKAVGSFIGCLDADCMPERSSLKILMGHFDDENVSCVVSTIKVTSPKNILEGVQYTEYLIAAFLKKMRSFLGALITVPGPLSVFRKEALLKLGPYKDGHKTEDLEMALRMQDKGFKIVHALDSIVYTIPQSNLKELFKQRVRWTRGFLLNLKDYSRLLDFKKHGNLSILLFYNLFGAVLSVSLVFYAIYRTLHFFLTHLSNALLVNFDYSPYLSNISFPTISLKPAFLLGIVTLSLFISFLFLGKKLTFDKVKIKKKAFFYVLIYSFLNTSWWILACGSILLKKEISWK